PFDRVAGAELIEPLPEILILNRLAARGAPAARLPRRKPLRDPAPHVFGIGVEARLHRALQGLERANYRGELHAVVGRQGLGALELLLALARLEERPPAAGPRIAAAGAVGIDLDHAWVRVVGLTIPPITAGFSLDRVVAGEQKSDIQY